MDELTRFAPAPVHEREELPSFFFSEDTLAEAAQITLADLLESRAFAPYVLVSVMNANQTVTWDELVGPFSLRFLARILAS